MSPHVAVVGDTPRIRPRIRALVQGALNTRSFPQTASYR